MKKLLILMLVLGLASVANAGLVLTVDGEVAPDEIELYVCDHIALDILVEDCTLFSGGDLLIRLTTDEGELDASGVVFEMTPPTQLWIDFEYPPYVYDHSWHEDPTAWEAPWVVLVDGPQQTIVSGGNLKWNTHGEYTLMDLLDFHCVEATPVTIELVAYSDLFYYTYTEDPTGPPEGPWPLPWVQPEIDEIMVLYEQGTVIDSIAVTQVPEPATIALLGLGGLALLRRRK